MDGSTPRTAGDDACPGDACPDDAALDALAHGNLSESEAARWSAHLDGCEHCRQRLEAVLGTVVPEGETPLRGDATQTFDRNAPPSAPPPAMGVRTRMPSSIGPYRIVQVLGEGGFGMVYEALQEEPIRRRVALKVLKAGMDSRAVLSRFEAERQALALMDHPNIAKIIDAGQTERGRPYFVMERVQGVVITDYCEDNRLPLAERIGLFIDVCHAVQHAHQKGVIHRDLKPSNVLVSLVDGSPVPKIIDFGIAKALSAPLTSQTVFTMQGQLIGTPEYMSPEQAEVTGLDVDTRADVYSLGVLLYELLTGTLPFDKDKFREAGIAGIQRLIRESEPPKPSTRLSTLKDEPRAADSPLDHPASPPKTPTRGLDLDALARQLRGELDWIVLKCLEKDRTRRYPSVVGLGEDLQRYLDDEPVLARPPSTTYRARKFMRKHRTGVVVAVGLVVTLVMGLVGTTLGLVRATRAEKLAAERYEVMDQLRGQAAEQRDAAELAEREVSALAEGLKRQAYAANIHAASITLGVTPLPAPGELDNLPRDAVDAARGYLQRCPPELRGWEWRLLAGVVDRSHRVDVGQANFADVAIDPSGKVFAAADLAGFVTLRDLSTGDRRGRIAAHLLGLGATGLAFTPDGEGLLTCSWGEPDVIEWDTQTLAERRRLGSAARGLVCVGRSPDGRWVAAGTTTGQLLLWDTSAASPDPQAWPAHGDQWVRGLTFSPDGSLLASAGNDGRVRVWSVAQGQTLHDWSLTLVADPDGSETASAESDPVEAHAVAFSADGAWLAASGSGGRLQVWSLDSAEPLASLQGHDRQTVTAVRFVGTDLWSTGKDAGLTRWIGTPRSDGPPSWRSGRTSFGHTQAVTALAVTPDGRHAVTGSDDRTCRLWGVGRDESRSGSELGRGPIVRLGLPNLRRGAAVGLSDSGRALVAWSDASSAPLALSTIDLGAERRVLETTRLPYGRAWDFMWWHPLVGSDDGRAAAIPNRTVRIPLVALDEAGRVTGVEAFQPDDEVWHDLDFAPGNAGLAVGHAGGLVSLWEPGGHAVRHRIEAHDPRFRVQCVRYSPDGAVLATASEDRRVGFWSTQTAEPVGELPEQSEEVAAMVFDPAGERLVTADFGGTIRVWDWRTAALLLSIPQAHDRIISALTFTADGQRLLSSGKVDRALRVWDVETGENLFQIEALPYPAWDVETAGPDDAVLVTLETGPPLLFAPRPVEGLP